MLIEKNYAASIFLAATSSFASPEIVFGKYDFTNNKFLEDKAKGSVTIDAGKATYTCSSAGLEYQNYRGAIKMKMPSGEYRYYPFEGSFKATK